MPGGRAAAGELNSVSEGCWISPAEGRGREDCCVQRGFYLLPQIPAAGRQNWTRGAFDLISYRQIGQEKSAYLWAVFFSKLFAIVGDNTALFTLCLFPEGYYEIGVGNKLFEKRMFDSGTETCSEVCNSTTDTDTIK